MSDSTRRTMLPDARQFPRFAGLSTFCRFPLIDSVSPDHHPIDWALYGIPYDGGVTYRPGARFGPRAVRDASQYAKPAHLFHQVNIIEILSLADAGDAPVRPYSCKGTLDCACDFAMKLGEPSHTKLLAVGGDHSIAYANIRATWERRGKPVGGLALLHLDAHLDTVNEIWDEKWNHGSVFRRAIEDGLIDPKRMISIGIRGPLNLLSDLDYAHETGSTIVTADNWLRGDGQKTIDTFVASLGEDETYLSFDIDCVDPAFAPGTGTPCCGGFSSTDVFAIMRSFAGVKLVGADVVEVLPDRDSGGITALLASHMLIEILALAAVHNREKE